MMLHDARCEVVRWYVMWSQRFQKAYESLEHEAALERKKLMAEHQRRIQDELARKKTEAMNQYLDSLSDDEPDVSPLHRPNTLYISKHNS